MLTVQMTMRKMEVVLMDRCGALGLAIVMYLEYGFEELICLSDSSMNISNSPFHCDGRHGQDGGNDGHVGHEVGHPAEVGTKHPVPGIIF